MKSKITSLTALLLSVILLLSGCKGNPLPSGMEETALLEAGKNVMLQLVGGEYEAVYSLLRADVAETTSPQAISDLVLQELSDTGVYQEIDSSMVTGQSTGGEDYGVAVLYCKFSDGRVLFRLAFDPEMELIGMQIKRQ